MTEFKPSDDFESKVMKRIFLYEERKKSKIFVLKRLLDYKSIRYAISAGGVFLALNNIYILFIYFFIPIACK